ncbi:transglycosylase SLT domain-containing protein [Desulfobacterales bacterium HSG16]|nr:transglycosylase SLT domain-containing protein [Desulfobacterales bacterium HSG16]
MRVWILSLSILFLIGCSYAEAGESFAGFNRIKKYDRHFSKYSKRYFGPGFDWRFFKAQAIAESRLKQDARSHVGAVGVMQIMPRTFKEIKKKNSAIKGGLLKAKWNIAAGIWYDRTLWKIFTARRPFQDRVKFMFGSYNAGKGTIIKAQKKAAKKGLNPNLWQSIESVLPEITGRRSLETLKYIKKIQIIKRVLR